MEFSPFITLRCLFSVAGGTFSPITMPCLLSSLLDIVTLFFMTQSPNWPSLYVHNAVQFII